MLSDLQVRQAKVTGKAYSLVDFDGLYFHISATGFKAWHFRFTWGGKRERMSFGGYPALSLKDARHLRDEARAMLAKDINPHSERKRKRHVIVLAGEHTFQAIYDKWLAHRSLSLENEGRQSTPKQIGRVFAKDVFPVLRHLTVYDVTRAHLLDIIGRVEKRGSLSVAEKLRTWFSQLFTYASVVVPNMGDNPAKDLDVVAMPLPPVENNPFLRMPELPAMLQTLRKYSGRLNTQLGLRLLLLTGVRTGELRYATPDQFDLERGLWIIPVVRLKQRKQLTKKKRQRFADIPPYIVPLSLQAQEVVRHLLGNLKPAQVYLIPGDWCLKKPLSENTLNGALKRMGYEDQLTGHGVRATISTALNELGYPPKWVDAQLSHADPDRISATYNHAEYVEQRRVMMQDWADRLDLFEQNQVEVASTHLTITLQGLPTIAGQAAARPESKRPSVDRCACTGCASGSSFRLSTFGGASARVRATHAVRGAARALAIAGDVRGIPQPVGGRLRQAGWQVPPLDHLRDSGWQSPVDPSGSPWTARPGLATRPHQTQADSGCPEAGAARHRHLAHLSRTAAAIRCPGQVSSHRGSRSDQPASCSSTGRRTCHRNR